MEADSDRVAREPPLSAVGGPVAHARHLLGSVDCDWHHAVLDWDAGGPHAHTEHEPTREDARAHGEVRQRLKLCREGGSIEHCGRHHAGLQILKGNEVKKRAGAEEHRPRADAACLRLQRNLGAAEAVATGHCPAGDGCEPIGRAGRQDQHIEAQDARDAVGDDVESIVAHGPG